MSGIRRRMAAWALAGAAALALTGCASEGAGVLPPVIVDIAELDGTSVEVPEGGTIDITGDDAHYTEWTADIADPSIASFVPGRDDGSAQFNPGIEALAPGETAVRLDNSASGDTVGFTVVVTD